LPTGSPPSIPLDGQSSRLCEVMSFFVVSGVEFPLHIFSFSCSLLERFFVLRTRLERQVASPPAVSRFTWSRHLLAPCHPAGPIVLGRPLFFFLVGHLYYHRWRTSLIHLRSPFRCLVFLFGKDEASFIPFSWVSLAWPRGAPDADPHPCLLAAI